MKKVLKIEIQKAIFNRMFVISIVIGICITLLSFFQQLPYMHTEVVSNGTEDLNPWTPVYILFNHWIGGEIFSLGTTIYFFVFPLLICIPYGWSYCNEKKRGYSKLVAVQAGKMRYLFSKYVALFLSGGITMIIPLIFNFLLCTLFFPAVTPMVIYCTSYGVFRESLLSTLYYSMPFLYVFLYLCIDFVFAGLLACICMAVAAFLKQTWITLVIPFFVCLLIHFSGRYIYVSSTVVYKQISPFYFLRPADTGYAASFSIILGMAVCIFLVTFIIGVVWERKHEIY